MFNFTARFDGIRVFDQIFREHEEGDINLYSNFVNMNLNNFDPLTLPSLNSK